MTIYPIITFLLFSLFLSGIGIITLTTIQDKIGAIIFHMLVVVLHIAVSILFRDTPIALIITVLSAIVSTTLLAFVFPKISTQKSDMNFVWRYFQGIRIEDSSQRIIIISFFTGVISSVVVISMIYLVNQLFAR